MLGCKENKIKTEIIEKENENEVSKLNESKDLLKCRYCSKEYKSGTGYNPLHCSYNCHSMASGMWIIGVWC